MFFHLGPNRRSAVERLEETKANYVKTGRVLDKKQNFEHGSKLHVTCAGPQLDVLLKGRAKSLYNCDNLISYVNTFNVTDNRNNVSSITSELVPRSSSNLESRYSAETKTMCRSDEKISTINHESPKLSVLHHDCFKTKYKTATRDRQVRSQALCYGAKSLNGNENSPLHNGFASHENLHNKKYFVRSEEKNEHSDLEHYSLEPSDDSADQDNEVVEEKKQSCKTSDYVSRSSSFKCSVSSDKVKNLVKSFESKISNAVSPTTSLTTVQEKPKPVSRSKSDMCGRFSKNFRAVTEAPRNSSDEELSRFFDTLGMGDCSFQNMAASPESPVRFFGSVSSINSDDHLSNAGSGDSVVETPREGLTDYDLRRHAPTETSIVEKNARVVKWLYNCHNAIKTSCS